MTGIPLLVTVAPLNKIGDAILPKSNRIYLGKRAALVVLAVAAIAGLPALAVEKPERFYYQEQWGTKNFQLLRADDGGLSLDIPQPGDYKFTEDGFVVEEWDGLEANWEHLAGVKVFPVVADINGAAWISRKPASEGKNKWSLVDFTPAPGSDHTGAPQDIYHIGWQVQAAQGASPILKSCTLLLPKGIGNGAFSLFADHTKPYPTYLPQVAPEKRAPLSAPASAPRVFVADTSRLIARADWVQAITPWANARFPNAFGVDMGSVLWSGLKRQVDAYRQAAHAYTLFESSSVGPQLAWLRNNNLSSKRKDGFTPAQPIWPAAEIGQAKTLSYHEEDTAQTAVLDFARERMNSAFDLGFDAYLLIDYIWPYTGGHWGFGESTIAYWKQILDSKGPTIDLVDPDETWHFADYWKHFESYPLEPAEFGLKSWQEFNPVQDREVNPQGARRVLLFNALWHFQYLVYADHLGKAAEDRHREFSVSVNPEDFNNGTDFSLLGRLKHLSSIGIEFFGNPNTMGAWRHTLPWLRYRTTGPTIDLVGEINAGGHGASRYDRETAFAFYYDATATVLPRFYNTQYQEKLWQAPSPFDHAQLDRLNHWSGGARAFLLRRTEAARIREPRSEVTVVASRSVLESVRGSTASLAQAGNLAPYLHALNIDFEQVGRDAWSPERDPHTKVLFYCPAMASAAEWQSVKQWISSGSGKTLVLHGANAWKDDAHPDHFTPLAAALAPLAPKNDAVLHVQGGDLKTTLCPAKINQQTELKSDEGTPLLSSWQSGGNKVLHIEAELNPLEVTDAGLQIVASAAGKCGIIPFAQRIVDWSTDHATVDGGDVAILWNTSELKAESAKNYYARQPLAQPTSVILLVPPQKSYIVYLLFEDRGWQQTSDANGHLPIPVTSSKEIVYYGPKSANFAATIQAARQTYQEVKQESEQAAQSAR